MKLFQQELTHLENNLEQLELNATHMYSSAGTAIQLCTDTINNMREQVLKKGFINLRDECLFFKTIKPKVVGYLIYYWNLVHIKRYSPLESWKEKHKFYIEYISILKNYFIENHEIYEYYIRNLTHLDDQYFIRNSSPVELHCDSIASLIDIKFSTAKDMVFAQIMGNTLTINFLKHKISRKTKNPFSNIENTNMLKWTGAKVDLVELVYALHSTGSINHGRADIKEIAKAFESVMHIELGDYYRIFLEIRNRKLHPTKFLDHLKDCLQNRMIEADG
ncbi:hypothetical protein LS48_01935 [Aequorivita aquimaris]|uniref:Tetracycline regulation of excision, RteC n=1 Tax=Aequorivita aquimaris TaxID=1548749 RepID=A0A137RM32_9FLAO|nr:RteC domain-containing protein [Aequorivita aquimaris]KXO01248.1 hypothetical protein LS48_01935 [Aequorivita aquimaris]